MKKSTLSALSWLLAVLMALATLSACTTPSESDTEGDSQQTEETTIRENESDPNEEQTSKNDPEKETESESQKESESETEKMASLSGIPNGDLIENAHRLANGIIAGFVDSSRSAFEISNQKMTLRYDLHPYLSQQITTLQNSKGGIYLHNTSDVFVKMTDGRIFYASDSTAPATANLYRYGYYYYEARFEEQNFIGSVNDGDGFAINLDAHTRTRVKTAKSADGSLRVTLTSESDPSVSFNGVSFSADEYAFAQVTMKADTSTLRPFQIFVTAGGSTSLSEKQSSSFQVYPSDEYITYTIPLYPMDNYTGQVEKFRFDLAGEIGDVFEIKEIKIIKGDRNAPATLGLNRSFLVYSDKMHHFLQVSSSDVATEGIAEIGLETRIDKSTVQALIIKDKNGTHSSPSGIDAASVEYVGFLIKGVGVFGYILPADNSGGVLSVTEAGDEYIIIQSRAPKNGQVAPSGIKNAATGKIDATVPLNGNDFFMGQRIYTDESSTLDAFLREAELERHPLTADNFVIDAEASSNASYAGYDAIRGIYTLKLDSAGFSGPYFIYPNKHYNVKFTVKGDNSDRNIYLMAASASGCLECAALLDENNMMLPIPIEVGKNFSEANLERNRWNIDDATYGEAIIPMVIKAQSSDSYNFINLYQNWGTIPLKQISWIQASAPCYHLSTGVVETNCITALMATKRARTLNTLPDHRTMSAPLWSDQPQHNSAGSHQWLAYTTADKRYNATEFTDSVIDSFGPVYADVKNSYVSDDGCIKVSYTHTEFPQTDENRAFYEIRYEILDSVSFSDFGNDFNFYATTPNDPTGRYTKVGYLNKDNECVIADANKDKTKPIEYVLGDKCPYFSFFDMENYTSTSQQGYGNLSFLIYNAEFIINGAKCDPRFLLTDRAGTLSLSLDLDKVTLKAGDSFTVNAIVMPWGSQESIYDSDEFAGDQNVRNVRENTLLNPLTPTAVADCTVMESVFVPRLKTTNGRSASFTLTGGENNVPVRIYGFDKLTVPVIEELVDGKWQTYTVNSSYTPDYQGNRHFYDGYSVHYDGDGTFSYCFAVAMDHTDKDGRTFRITAAKDFEGWPKELPEIEGELIDLPLNVYSDADSIYSTTAMNKQFGSVEFIEDGNFVRFSPSETVVESVFTAYPGGNGVTGQYFVMKYRLPDENTHKMTAFEIYTSTVNDSAKGGDGFGIAPALKNDGQWHIAIVDLASWKKDGFSAASDGSYTAKYLRVDIFNNKFPVTNLFDLAFIGISDNTDDIYKLCDGVDVVQFADLGADGAVRVRHLDPTSGEFVELVEETEPVKDAIAEEDGFSLYFNAEELISLSKVNGSEHRGTTELGEDGAFARFNICTDETKHEAYRKESYINAYKPKDVLGVGRYLVIKYRAERQIGCLQIYASTVSASASGSCCVQINEQNGAFVGNNQWQTLVIDLEKLLPDAYKPTSNGKHCAQIIRLDLFNLGKVLESSDSTYVDIAFLGLTTDYTRIALDKGAVLFDGEITNLTATE